MHVGVYEVSSGSPSSVGCVAVPVDAGPTLSIVTETPAIEYRHNRAFNFPQADLPTYSLLKKMSANAAFKRLEIESAIDEDENEGG